MGQVFLCGVGLIAKKPGGHPSEASDDERCLAGTHVSDYGQPPHPKVTGCVLNLQKPGLSLCYNIAARNDYFSRSSRPRDGYVKLELSDKSLCAMNNGLSEDGIPSKQHSLLNIYIAISNSFLHL